MLHAYTVHYFLLMVVTELYRHVTLDIVSRILFGVPTQQKCLPVKYYNDLMYIYFLLFITGTAI